MLEMKNCPFCGGENISLKYYDCDEHNEKVWESCDDDEGAVFPYVECRDCENTVSFSGLGTGKEIIAAWNERPIDAVPVTRCKNCEYSLFIRSCSKYECKKGCGTLKYATDFCSCGRPKDGANGG